MGIIKIRLVDKVNHFNNIFYNLLQHDKRAR